MKGLRKYLTPVAFTALVLVSPGCGTPHPIGTTLMTGASRWSIAQQSSCVILVQGAPKKYSTPLIASAARFASHSSTTNGSKSTRNEAVGQSAHDIKTAPLRVCGAEFMVANFRNGWKAIKAPHKENSISGRLRTSFRFGNLAEHLGLLLLKGIAAVPELGR